MASSNLLPDFAQELSFEALVGKRWPFNCGKMSARMHKVDTTAPCILLLSRVDLECSCSLLEVLAAL